MTEEIVALGLAGVIAVETKHSMVDGERGELIIGGLRAEELAKSHSFEQLAERLWDSDGLSDRLVKARAEAFERGGPVLKDPMDTIRAQLGMLETTGDLVADAVAATATVPVAIASWWHDRNGTSRLAPTAKSHVAAYLEMLGLETSEARVGALTRYLVTVSDHGLNASTFTARVIASTRSDLISAVTGAVGALKGPLHGGAPGPVLDMLDEIGTADRAEDWLRTELEAGNRIMGMGHRVYRVRDPRAAIFESALTDLGDVVDSADRLELARAVETAATEVLAERYPDRDLRANVEFYTAVLLESLGIDRALFAPSFAVGRVLGWSAHVMEQAADDRLIRPRARYRRTGV